MYWTSYDGREILIKDLSVRHMVNILNWMTKANTTVRAGSYSPAVINLIENEAKIRIMRGWAANKGMPRQLPDGNWIVINQTFLQRTTENIKTMYHKAGIANKIKSLEVHNTGK